MGPRPTPQTPCDLLVDAAIENFKTVCAAGELNRESVVGVFGLINSAFKQSSGPEDFSEAYLRWFHEFYREVAAVLNVEPNAERA